MIAAFEHSGPARKLAHQLKYRGLTSYADLVAATVAPAVPGLPLVAVPRARSRWLKYGIDPAAEITRRLSVRLGVPIVDALAAPLHSARRAGGNHGRSVSPYRLRESVLESVVLVDDVITTGATLAAAIDAIGCDRVAAVVAANAVPAGPRPATAPRPRAP